MNHGRIETGRTGSCDWVRLHLGDAMAEIIPARGALLARWEVPRRGAPLPILWLPPGAHEMPFGPESRLLGGMPLLFPIAGPLQRDGRAGAYLVDGRPYLLPRHGFGHRLPWVIEGSALTAAEASLTLRLRDTAETRAAWPFAFETSITYRLSEAGLRTDWRLRNLGATTMRLHPGLHPYFSLPFTGAGQRADVLLHSTARHRYIPFDDAQPWPGPAWSGKTAPLPGGALSLAALPAGQPMLIGDLESPGFVIEDRAGGVCLRGSWAPPARPGDGPYINLWTLSEEVRMFCVEPVMAPPNAMNHGHALVTVAPGEAWTWWFGMDVDGECAPLDTAAV
jgi:galactose mutarotase-like enzyme